jgi:hypothetical protein
MAPGSSPAPTAPPLPCTGPARRRPWSRGPGAGGPRARRPVLPHERARRRSGPQASEQAHPSPPFLAGAPLSSLPRRAGGGRAPGRALQHRGGRVRAAAAAPAPSAHAGTSSPDLLLPPPPRSQRRRRRPWPRAPRGHRAASATRRRRPRLVGAGAPAPPASGPATLASHGRRWRGHGGRNELRRRAGRARRLRARQDGPARARRPWRALSSGRGGALELRRRA